MINVCQRENTEKKGRSNNENNQTGISKSKSIPEYIIDIIPMCVTLSTYWSTDQRLFGQPSRQGCQITE
jgi:hypothetical protein